MIYAGADQGTPLGIIIGVIIIVLALLAVAWYVYISKRAQANSTVPAAELSPVQQHVNHLQNPLQNPAPPQFGQVQAAPASLQLPGIASVQLPDGQPTFCSRCGAGLSSGGASFCDACGAAVHGVQEEQREMWLFNDLVTLWGSLFQTDPQERTET